MLLTTQSPNGPLKHLHGGTRKLFLSVIQDSPEEFLRLIFYSKVWSSSVKTGDMILSRKSAASKMRAQRAARKRAEEEGMDSA